MKTLKKFAIAFIVAHFAFGSSSLFANQTPFTDWSKQELATLKQFSLSRLKPAKDPSNKYINDAKAISLGKQFFNEQQLSSNKQVSCNTCHIKESNFTDNKVIAIGSRSGLRNTPTLLNVAQQNWFFWDGSKDSLWSQALSSIENPDEHGFNRVQLLHFIKGNEHYRSLYNDVFDVPFPPSTFIQNLPKSAGPHGSLDELKAWKALTNDQKNEINQVAINISKSIAAYVSTISSSATRFDNFVDDLLLGKNSHLLNQSEQNGLRLFISKKSACSNCHFSPIFSNKEFHNIGTGIPAQDNGRSEVIDSVIRSSFNCLGKYSDAKPKECNELRFANTNRHALSGAYKTPTLRGISKTAPYMHDGRFKDLKDVLNFYAEVNDPEKSLSVDLPIINLSKEEQDDIVNFLLTL